MRKCFVKLCSWRIKKNKKKHSSIYTEKQLLHCLSIFFRKGFCWKKIFKKKKSKISNVLCSYECDINVALDLHTCRNMLFSSFIPDIDDLFSVNKYRFFSFFSTVKERGVVKLRVMIQIQWQYWVAMKVNLI